MASIVSPLSRFLAVSDLDAALAFYRDVLGFAVREPERDAGFPAVADLVRGEARIQVGTGDSAWDSAGERRPGGAAILFLETDDVDALRAEVAARGGEPSEIERVNWIKMLMFQVRDPDGHTLWFGRTFQEPDHDADPARQLRKGIPELPLSDVPAGVRWYREVMGFGVDYEDGRAAVLQRDAMTLLLVARTPEHGGIGSCYAYVRDVDGWHAELRARGANVQGEPVSRPWGLRDFEVRDPEGNRLRFGQTFE